MDSITVVVITHNNQDHLDALIQSLLKSNRRLFRCEFIFIDNASTDGTREILQSETMKKLGAITILNRENLGFAKAVNQGIKKACSNYITLLNPDTMVTPDAFEILYHTACKFNGKAIVGGDLIDALTKTPQNSHTTKPTLFIGLFEFTSLKYLIPSDLNIFSKTFWYKNSKKLPMQEVWSVCGAFMMFHKQVAEKIHGFDENFFLYLEDLDFCIRAKKLGYKVFFCPSASIYHISGGSSMKSNPIFRNDERSWRTSRRYFFQKHLGKLGYTLFQIVCMIEELILDFRKNYEIILSRSK